MDKQEFFLLIPGIIYGVAIVDLLKVFAHKKTYFELTGWGVIYMLGIIIIWLDLYYVLDDITHDNFSFVLIIVQAIFYARGANIITPEEKDVDTKKYFLEIRKPFFLVLGGIVTINLAVQLLVRDDMTPIWFRASMILLATAVAFWDKKWFRVSVMVLVLLLQLSDLMIKGGLFN